MEAISSCADIPSSGLWVLTHTPAERHPLCVHSKWRASLAVAPGCLWLKGLLAAVFPLCPARGLANGAPVWGARGRAHRTSHLTLLFKCVEALRGGGVWGLLRSCTLKLSVRNHPGLSQAIDPHSLRLLAPTGSPSPGHMAGSDPVSRSPALLTPGSAQRSPRMCRTTSPTNCARYFSHLTFGPVHTEYY